MTYIELTDLSSAELINLIMYTATPNAIREEAVSILLNRELSE